jgi:demethylmenaquinone methyltransferase/2-methoxy-6-polyprenyl-1,4-benzoquinol methylase
MARDAVISTRKKTQSFYDRIADVHNFALKLNGYRRSVAKYLRSLDLELGPDSTVLDAGSGTGIVTMSLLDSGFRPKKVVALDLSFNSLRVSREQFEKKKKYSDVEVTQGNILTLPFAENTFDMVMTCGVLEYVNLDDGLKELSRVLKPNGKLVLLPVKAGIVGSMLEILYNFKIHPLNDVKAVSTQYFDIVGNHEFPINEPISWSKTIFLLEKKAV